MLIKLAKVNDVHACKLHRWLVDVTERAPTTALKTQNVLIQNQENQINVNSLTETGPRNLKTSISCSNLKDMNSDLHVWDIFQITT